MKITSSITLNIVLLGISVFCYADIPVVDRSSQSSAKEVPLAQEQPQFSDRSQNVSSTQDLTLEQRVARLEQQINNLNRQNLNKRLDDLQQQMQTLSGNREETAHQLQQLEEQLKNFYQDLSQRMPKQESAKTPKNITSSKVNNVKSNDASMQSSDEVLKEQKLYQDAFDLLQNKKYSEASEKFRSYISSYPRGSFLANSHYWLGEINFSNQQFKLALNEFDIVISKYPKSTKVPDAMLKKAMIYEQTGKHDLANKELANLQKRYPHSPAAQLGKTIKN